MPNEHAGKGTPGKQREFAQAGKPDPSLQGVETMLKRENQKDKKRFEELKKTEEEHGRDEKTATEIAAQEVKELREQEGRSKST
jgi:hypothetical protein